MSKSYAAKDAARKRRGTRRKAIKVMAERNSLPTIAVWELGDAHRGMPPNSRSSAKLKCRTECASLLSGA